MRVMFVSNFCADYFVYLLMDYRSKSGRNDWLS